MMHLLKDLCLKIIINITVKIYNKQPPSYIYTLQNLSKNINLRNSRASYVHVSFYKILLRCSNILSIK